MLSPTTITKLSPSFLFNKRPNGTGYVIPGGCICSLQTNQSKKSLSGKICVVTGGSRGLGRGIALGLGELGATVYITGRSMNSPSDGFDVIGGTLSETAHEVNNIGGVCIPVKVDHQNDAEVEALFQKVIEEQGRLDLLVNNAWGAPMDIDEMELKGGKTKFWEQGCEYYEWMFGVGVRGMYSASCQAAPLLANSPAALLVNINSFGLYSYTFCVTYGAAKAAVDRLTRDMALELKPLNVACLQVLPGVVRSERLKYLDQQGSLPPSLSLSRSESPLLTGRVIAALTADHNRAMQSTGERLISAEVAEELGLLDEDGTQPPSIRDLRYMVPFICDSIGIQSPPKWLVPAVKLPFQFMESEPPTWLFQNKNKSSNQG